MSRKCSSSSEYTGVSWGSSKWVAHITIRKGDTLKYLGSYKNASDAALAWDRSASANHPRLSVAGCLAL